MKKDGYKITIGYVGVFIAVIGIINMIPILTTLFYPTDRSDILSFLVPSLLSIILGLLLSRFLKNRSHIKLSLRQDTVIVLMVWIAASIISAMPFLLSGELSFTLAIFESVSGWTTTGLSVIDVSQTDNIFLFHRSLSQFFGGVGIVLVASSALSSTFSIDLYSAEGHEDRLLPNLVKSSRLIMKIYLIYIVVGIFLYVWFGMPVFDAINHSMAALSTGGFGITPNSIGDYNSFGIEIVTIVLMILGTTSFLSHLLIIKRRFKDLLKVGEIRFMALLMSISTIYMIVLLLRVGEGSIYSQVRNAVFQVISASTTTGFSTIDFSNWNSASNVLVIILMIIGGGVGSTSGGIKLYRIYVLLKASLWKISRSFMPDNAIKENHIIKTSGKSYIDDKDISEVGIYCYIYMIILFIGTMIISSYGYSIGDSLFEYASALGTVGLSVGITSSSASYGVLWTEIIGMILGRLEIYIVLIGIIKIGKDIKNRLNIG